MLTQLLPQNLTGLLTSSRPCARSKFHQRIYIALIVLLFFVIIAFKLLTSLSELELANHKTFKPDASIYGGDVYRYRKTKCHSCLYRYVSYSPMISSSVCDHQHKTVHEGKSTSPHTLFLIISSEDGYRKRKAARKTWLEVTRQNRDDNFRHVFYMGLKDGKSVSNQVKLEHYIHGDIVVGNVTDNRENATAKLIQALQWAGLRCAADRVLVTTDNVLVNHTQYLRYLDGYELKNSVAGRCMYRVNSIQIANNSYWYSAHRENPWLYYPDFCLADAMVIDKIALSKIVPKDMMMDTPYFRIPSVYLGFVMHNADVKAVNMEGFYRYEPNYNQCSDRSAAVIKLGDSDNLTDLWPHRYDRCVASIQKKLPINNFKLGDDTNYPEKGWL